jgi:dTDP-glucose pyrophosphorylase
MIEKVNPAQSWQRALVEASATLQHTIRNLDESGMQIALVTSPDGALLGTVTDGDIRRGLLRGLGLDSHVERVMNREPLVVPATLGRDAVLQLMRANKLHQLPVVDEGRRITGLHLWDDLLVPTQRPNLMVIMAGGLGTRLRPLTDHCPKPLLQVSGKPMLEHILERAKGEGFRQFIFAVHYLGSMIESYFGDGSRWQVQIRYLKEESPLGTAGALGLLQPRPRESFVVSNGDVLTDIHYGELVDFHQRHAASGTMAVRLHEWQHPFGVVRTKGVDIVGFEEKPVQRTHINAGIYVLEPEALELLEVGEPCDMPTLFARLKQQTARTIVYPMHEPWLDVGREDDLHKAQAAQRGGSSEER